MSVLMKRLGYPQTCPLCHGELSRWPPRMGKEAKCSQCGAVFWRSWFWNHMISQVEGEGKYRSHLFTGMGWQYISEGKVPFQCPGCGNDPTFIRGWVGKFPNNKTKSLRCGCCGRNLILQGNSLMEDTSDITRREPTFPVVVFGGTVFLPESCCVCNQSPVEKIPLEVKTTKAIGTRIFQAAVTLNFPFCQIHEKDAGEHVGADLILLGGIVGIGFAWKNSIFAQKCRELNPLHTENAIRTPLSVDSLNVSFLKKKD
jgi:hypothetical protein